MAMLATVYQIHLKKHAKEVISAGKSQPINITHLFLHGDSLRGLTDEEELSKYREFAKYRELPAESSGFSGVLYA
jgi:hypothetical protein